MSMLIPHLSALCEVYLGLLAAAARGQADSSLRRSAREACAALRRFVRVFPIVAPIVGVHQGRLAWLAGRGALAVKRWQAARAAAERLAMPYEQARAARALAAHGPAAEIAGHAAQARVLFDEIGVPARVQEHDSDGDQP
jgi:hypothetical protein